METLSWVEGPAIGGALLLVFDPPSAVAIGAAISVAALATLPGSRRRLDPVAAKLPFDGLGTGSILAGVTTIVTRPDVAAPLLLVGIVDGLNGAEVVRLVLVSAVTLLGPRGGLLGLGTVGPTVAFAITPALGEMG